MSSDQPPKPDPVNSVIDRIDRAIRAAGRPAKSVQLVAVSKTRSSADIRAAWQAGARAFGENYVQEALPKIDALRDLPISWHFIGHIQGNKTRDIAAAFDWVHTVDRERLIGRLATQTPDDKTLNVLIQVNIDGDPAKGGVPADDTGTLARMTAAIRQSPRLRLRGLMTMLAESTPPLQGYSRLGKLFATMGPGGGDCWDTLSMGMSADFEDAIACGATLVRVGQAVFGPRSNRQSQEFQSS